MSTPREIKAVDVARGMRVRVTQHYDGQYGTTVETIEGEVIAAENANLQFGNGAQRYLGYDHPVTVLAEPEPEWVEGAWYWTRHRGGGEKLTVRKRGKCGWVTAGQAEAATYLVPDEAIDAFGRVLIIDWPGDDVARDLAGWPDETIPLRHIDEAAAKVADAIRTQGGVR